MRVDKVESEVSIYKPTEYTISFKTTNRGEFDTVMGNRDKDFLVAPKAIFEKEAEKIISKHVLDMTEVKPITKIMLNSIYGRNGLAAKITTIDELHNVKCEPIPALTINKNPQYKVMFNPPATILWKDGKKYVSKAHNEEFDEEKGLLMCLAKANGISHLELKRMIKNAERPQEKKKKKK